MKYVRRYKHKHKLLRKYFRPQQLKKLIMPIIRNMCPSFIHLDPASPQGDYTVEMGIYRDSEGYFHPIPNPAIKEAKVFFLRTNDGVN